MPGRAMRASGECSRQVPAIVRENPVVGSRHRGGESGGIREEKPLFHPHLLDRFAEDAVVLRESLRQPLLPAGGETIVVVTPEVGRVGGQRKSFSWMLPSSRCSGHRCVSMRGIEGIFRRGAATTSPIPPWGIPDYDPMSPEPSQGPWGPPFLLPSQACP